MAVLASYTLIGEKIGTISVEKQVFIIWFHQFSIYTLVYGPHIKHLESLSLLVYSLRNWETQPVHYS